MPYACRTFGLHSPLRSASVWVTSQRAPNRRCAEVEIVQCELQGFCQVFLVVQSRPSIHVTPNDGTEGGEACPPTSLIRICYVLRPTQKLVSRWRWSAILPASSRARSWPDPWSKSSSRLTILKPRTRRICIRLSEEEYSVLRDLCSATGARSISDLTRDAVRGVVADTSREDTSGNDIRQVRARIRSIEKKILQLSTEISSFRPGGAGPT